jgi:hypothetical protein
MSEQDDNYAIGRWGGEVIDPDNYDQALGRKDRQDEEDRIKRMYAPLSWGNPPTGAGTSSEGVATRFCVRSSDPGLLLVDSRRARVRGHSRTHSRPHVWVPERASDIVRRLVAVHPARGDDEGCSWMVPDWRGRR